MEIYADVVFIINLIMDFLILWMTAKLCKKKIQRLRLIAGAVICAALSCLMMFLSAFSALINVVSAVIIIILGIFITFNPKTLKEALKYAALAHICAFAAGGASFAFSYMTDIKAAGESILSLTIGNFSFKILLVSICASYIFIKLFLYLTRKKPQQFRTLKIYFNNHSVLLDALIDTGNGLHEPISNAPVIIAEFDSIKEILPDKVKILFYEKLQDDLEAVLDSLLDTPFAERIRMIPFSSVGRENGVLIGFRPDKVEIYELNGENEGDREIEVNRVVIGIYNLKFSNGNTYQALLNPELCDL